MTRPNRAAQLVILGALLVFTPEALAKRSAPSEVPPVISGNVRYEAPHFENPCNQIGGCVVAYDATSNAQLWSATVYCVHYDDDLERDVQDVFITSLAITGGQLQVINEDGQHFAVDLVTHEVSGDEGGCASGFLGCTVAGREPKSASTHWLTIAGLFVAVLLRCGRRGAARIY